jgi:hypothetical protein
MEQKEAVFYATQTAKRATQQLDLFAEVMNSFRKIILGKMFMTI